MALLSYFSQYRKLKSNHRSYGHASDLPDTLGVPLVFVQLPIREDRPAIIRSEYASLAG